MAMGSNDGDMMSEINVTPLVDVMLVLLVVFIITAPLLAPQALKIKLPQTESLRQKDKPDNSSLVIDSQGSVSMDSNPVDDTALAQVLAVKSGNSEFQLQIQADQSVNYGRVAQVMAIAQKAGVSKLSFMTLTK
jgi:biopolymer transport protein ExbD